MKSKLFRYSFFMLMSLVFFACKDEEYVTFDPDKATPAVFNDPSLESTYTFEKANGENEFAEFSWSEVDFGMPTSNVYVLEVGDELNNFTPVVTTKDLKATVKISEMNKALEGIEADTLSYNTYQFRLVSYIANSGDQPTTGGLVSEDQFNTVIKPYPSHFKLFVVEGPNYTVEDKERYIISADAGTKYIGTLDMEAEKTYRLKSNDFEDGTARVYALDSQGKVVEGGATDITVDETGKYKIEVDLADGSIEMTKAQPLLWVPGSHNGWSHDLEDPVEGDPSSYNRVNLVSENNDGIYTGKVWLTGEFKFSDAPNWDGTNYGDAGAYKLTTDPEGSNHNVDAYNGAGLYEFLVNVNTLSFEILSFEAAEVVLPEGNALWVSGDHNAWMLNIRDVLLETEEGSNIFEGNVSLRGNGGLEFVVSPDGFTHETTYRSPVITEGMSEGDLVVDGTYTVRVPESQVYKITVDLNEMTYVLGDPYIAPPTMHLVGNATTIDWTETEALAMNNRNPEVGIFDLITEFKDGEFKFIQEQTWETSWGLGDESNTLAFNSQTNCPADITGTVFVNANFQDLTYELTRPSVGVIGDATPGAWDADTDMAYDAASNTWKLTLDLSAGELKFRAFDDWAYNWGGDGSGNLSGDNIAVPTAGTYEVTLDLANEAYSLEMK
ncbi:SusF/SusE family outer membrane protein [Aureibacter tunicatorum]|uniref:SusE outer membrane protein domain-containing protein n=1 Tax=Aureibacter tunicatorum TaxID=866807 RepID=A0AAE4BSC5_9BACT|nr:SusF/SusE family outer membrane protein [Aureibacter tunicatorum]MDR6238708.1 hypothetical protein [Aureibacter tunicatorum]BDD05361.1 hypothetical protein AUTU_28440 [Aureibacter tunicatorum]